MVKDHRTGAETSNVQEVMDGKILVGVENASGASIPDVERALLSGGPQVKRVDLQSQSKSA